MRAHTLTGADKHDIKSKLLSMLHGDKYYGKKKKNPNRTGKGD